METATMGKTLVTAKIENLKDLWMAEKGLVPPDQVRRIEVPDAVVDTGGTYLSLPARLIQQLGLDYVRTRKTMTAAGEMDGRIFSPVRLTIQERDCPIEVAELPDQCPAIIGVVPLELLDFVVDPKSQRLIGNPAHGGEWVIEQY
jgi:predicted aspartyl protease